MSEWFGPPRYDVERYPMSWVSHETDEYVIYEFKNLEFERKLVHEAQIWVRKEHDPYFHPKRGLRSLQNRHTATFVELDGKVWKDFRRVA